MAFLMFQDVRFQAGTFDIGGDGLLHWLLGSTRVGLAALAFGSVVTLFGGVPLYLLLRRFGWLGPFHLLLAGALLGLLAYLVVAIALGLPLHTLRSAFKPNAVTTLAPICGAVAGIVFWLIALKGRKERG